MHIRSLDLNLLRVLDALLEERNVSRAARRLGLSQPAVSHALGRLRVALKDPLFARTPRGMVPTPRGASLQGPLRAALEQVEGALAGHRFEPSRSTALFTLATNDYAGLTLLPDFCGRVAKLAPGVRLQIVPQKEMVPAEDLATGAIDLAFAVRPEDRPGLFQKILLRETFVCLVRDGHPAIKKRLTLKHYLEFDHLLISPFGGMTGTVDEALAKIGLKRRVRVSVPQFALAPLVLAQSDLVLTLPARIARTTAAKGFRSFPPPVELEGFTFHALWHERTQMDAAHRWLRERLFESAS